MNVKVISAILVLALASLACGFTVDLPRQAKVGAEVTESITVAEPDAKAALVQLSFGAGELNLAGGAKQLVNGTAVYNVSDLKPVVKTHKNGEVEIKQGDFESIPPFEGMKNIWDLQLGEMPMDLEISAGAYQGKFELGGLSLTNLTINDGASEVELTFTEPNLTEMTNFSYSTGASNVTMTGLANANFQTFNFNSGAGDYRLDFSGDLQQDATVSIDCGLSDLTLIIPQEMNAVVIVDGALADVQVDPGWSQKNRMYTQAGEGPTLTIMINMGAGNVTLRD